MAVCKRVYRRGKPSWLLGTLIVSWLMATPSPAFAATFCVATAQQLTDAFSAAQSSPGTNSIRLRPGTYGMFDGVSFTNSIGGDLFVSGDWNAGCTVRGDDPNATKIFGDTDASTWWLRGDAINIRLSVMSLLEVYSVIFLDQSSSCTYQGDAFTVERVRIDGVSQGTAQLDFRSHCHRSVLTNSFVTGGQQGVRFLTVDLVNPPPITATHNTIIESSSFSLRVDHFGSETGELNLYNNVFSRAGSSPDLSLRNVGALAKGNIWSTEPAFFNAALLPGSVNNLTGNPEVNSATGYPQPSSVSTNSGSPSIPGGLPPTDFDGGFRFIGSAPDRGAFETTVSDASSIVVTTQGDSGPGTLRQAFITANATPGPQVITFNIPGACPQSVFLQSPLPSLTDSGLLVINGLSQPGSSPNSLDNGNDSTTCIQVRRSAQVSSVSHAIRVPSTSTTLLIVRNIGFGGFDSAIELEGGNGHLIQGNYFGSPLPGNDAAVTIGAGSNGAKIGGSGSPEYRNTISDSSFAGIFIIGGDDVEIGNNYIGTRDDGLAAAANNVGIFVSNAEGTKIFRNLISGNSFNAVVLAGSSTADTSITDNRIGAPRATTGFPPSALGNGGSGVVISGNAHDTIVGGTFRDSANIIAFNEEDGVTIESGLNNAVIGNRIFSNDGLGIDLAANGVTLNSAHPNPIPANYANLGRKFPVLSGAAGGDFSGSISGTLTATRGSYRIALFKNFECDASGHGEGADSIGIATVLIPNLPGEHTVAFTASVQSATGDLDGWISATAADSVGNTSEFSACVSYVSSDVIFANGFD